MSIQPMYIDKKSNSLIRLLSIILPTLGLLSISSLVFGQATVNGSEISWPDNGWYQVQNADTYETLCNGGSSCTVAAGRYKVINHSTGEKFRVEVHEESESVSPEPTTDDTVRIIDGVVRVVGNTLSWPDNGWYQVQNTSDNSEVCSGVNLCQIQSVGTYRVINHTTGERFGPISIREITQAPDTTPSGYTITGNQVQWFSGGWHQLQNAVTYESVCEGRAGTICIVSAGVYKLINHSTGEQYSGIEVLDGTSSTPVLDAIPISVTGVAYTDTEIELFWQRAISSETISGYDITRNGSLVASAIDALSYYDNSVQPGMSYEYQVIAVDSSGRRGAAIALNIDTPAAYTTINIDNYLELSQYLFATAQASFTDSSAALVDSFSSDAIHTLSPFTPLSSRYDEEASRVYTQYSCDQGGSFTHSPTGSALGGESGSFSDCHYTNTQVDGSYSISNTLSKFVLNPGLTTDTSYELLAFTQQDDPSTELTGSSSYFNGTYVQVKAWYVERFMSPSFNGATQITNFNSRASAGSALDFSDESPAFEGSLTASFRIQSPNTGNKPISYSTTNRLVKNTEDGFYESGNILATTNDGSSLIIEFGTGNPDTANITVTTNDYTFTETLDMAGLL